MIDRTTNQHARVPFTFIEDVIKIDVDYPDVRVPTLIIHGTRDEVVPIAHSRTFAANKRHVRLVEVDDDHELITSLPQIFGEADRFLTPWLGS